MTCFVFSPKSIKMFRWFLLLFHLVHVRVKEEEIVHRAVVRLAWPSDSDEIAITIVNGLNGGQEIVAHLFRLVAPEKGLALRDDDTGKTRQIRMADDSRRFLPLTVDNHNSFHIGQILVAEQQKRVTKDRRQNKQTKKTYSQMSTASAEGNNKTVSFGS